MKSYSGDITILNNTERVRASLYQFNFIDGSSVYYASADTDVFVSFNSTTYSSGTNVGAYMERGGSKTTLAHWKIGVEVDTLTLDIEPGTATVEGEAFLSAVRNGLFDGAELIMSYAYWLQTGYANPISAGLFIPNIFVGRVAEVDAGRSLATFSVNSHLELLNQNMPRNLYQAGCVNTLYDASCTLVKASFGVNGSAASGCTTFSINTTSLSNATGYFDLGSIKFTSGANNGLERGVKSYTHGGTSVITTMSPFPVAPSASDTFTIYPGCDKTQATCTNKFSNLANFRGFPYVPEVATAV